ncbi:MAG TPA: ribosome maturation factor RimM [Candidatus Limnocylindria bacterium]|nr:ribosome maturation factor RimM [Candidatus Limnocylindria bacterium]
MLVGIVRGAHGLRGEVRVDAFTDVPTRFAPGSRLGSDAGVLIVESSRQGPRGLIVRFRGFADRARAEALRGQELRVTRAAAREAVGGAYLWADLIGLRARTPSGHDLGPVTEVLRAGETDVIVVRRADGTELLVPAIGSVVREVDVDGGAIVLEPQEEHP